jgi:catechol 2,3-dioxygenase-like lactoylglutathione lyase family enzyme
MISRIDHISIAVKDYKKALIFSKTYWVQSPEQALKITI